MITNVEGYMVGKVGGLMMEFTLEIGMIAGMKSRRGPNDVSFDGEAWRTEEMRKRILPLLLGTRLKKN